MAYSFPLKAIFTRVKTSNKFVYSVGTLVGGTAFAQGLALCALPLLTRLYSPAEFNVLAVYTSLLAIFSVIACLRLEIAIPMPERDEDAANLLALALCSTVAMVALLSVAVAIIPNWLVSSLKITTVKPYLWLIPLGTLGGGSYAGFQYWATRKRKFSKIARTRILQALGGTGVQTGAGIVGLGVLGLLLGGIVNAWAGLYGLASDAWRENRKPFNFVNWASMRAMLGQYSRFPKYSTFEALCNTAGIQVPVIIIAGMAIGPEAGYLMLATKVMAAPMTLIGGGVGQVYLAHAPEELRSGRLASFTTRILIGLAKTGVGPLLFAGIIAGPAFSILFGSEWRRAGELVSWMTPWFIFQFLSSPVSMVMHVTGHQRAMLLVTAGGLFIRLAAMLVAYNFFRNGFSESYACSGACFYLICNVIFYRIAGVDFKCFGASILKAWRPILVWCVAGGLIRLLMGIGG